MIELVEEIRKGKTNQMKRSHHTNNFWAMKNLEKMKKIWHQ